MQKRKLGQPHKGWKSAARKRHEPDVKYFIARHKTSREWHLILKAGCVVLGRFKTREAAETEAMMRACNEASAVAVTNGTRADP